MKKRFSLLLAMSLLTLASCNGEGVSSISSEDSTSSESSSFSSSSSSSSESSSTIELPKTIEVFSDPKFETGFHLMSTSTTGAHEVKYLDYDGKAKHSDSVIWTMAQWWTPFDFQYAPYSYEDGFHVYKNESRTLKVNTETGELDMQLNSWLEYQERFGGSRTAVSQTWSHFLISQDFREHFMLAPLESLILNFDFEIQEVTMFDEEHYNPSLHAAQFIMYFTIRNTKFNNFFWFGVPLFDNRGNDSKPSYNIDQGFEGATNSLIYRMGQSDFLPNGVKVGNKYNIHVDLIPFLQDALICGLTETSNPPLTGWDWNDCYIDYMNVGWELPGSFNIQSTISNLSLTAERP